MDQTILKSWHNMIRYFGSSVTFAYYKKQKSNKLKGNTKNIMATFHKKNRIEYYGNKDEHVHPKFRLCQSTLSIFFKKKKSHFLL